MKKFIPKRGQIDFTSARWCPVVNCVLKYKDKILIVKRSKKVNFYPGVWNSIGGFLDDKLSLEDKVREEVKEETGISPGDIISIKLGEIFDLEDPKHKKTWVVHPVLVKTRTGKVKLDWEADDYKWIKPSEAKAYELMRGFGEVTKRLSKWL